MSSGIQVKGDFLSMLDGQVLRVSFYDGGLSGVTRGGGQGASGSAVPGSAVHEWSNGR